MKVVDGPTLALKLNNVLYRVEGMLDAASSMITTEIDMSEPATDDSELINVAHRNKFAPKQ